MQLSQMWGVVSLRGGALDIFQDKDIKETQSLGFPCDHRLEAGRLVFPGLTQLALWVPYSSLDGYPSLPGLFLNGEEFIPRFMEGEKECFHCLYYA